MSARTHLHGGNPTGNGMVAAYELTLAMRRRQRQAEDAARRVRQKLARRDERRARMRAAFRSILPWKSAERRP